MHRFFAPVIEPLTRSLRPQTIVEIGSQSGAHTQKLLSLAVELGAKVHIIDPLPPENLADLGPLLAQAGQFHRTTSFEALERLPAADLYLIDGDHNWYTVTGELERISAAALRDSKLPVLCFHDVGWPYGRRDLYYAASRVPLEHQRPHRVGGLKVGHPGLAEDGLNAHLDHAEAEGGAQNGVLTAIDDFVAKHPGWALLTLPGLNGFAVLLPQSRLDEPFAQTLAWCRLSPPVECYLQAVERDRLALLTEVSHLRRRLKRASETEAKLRSQLQALTLNPVHRALQTLRKVKNRLTK